MKVQENDGLLRMFIWTFFWPKKPKGPCPMKTPEYMLIPVFFQYWFWDDIKLFLLTSHVFAHCLSHQCKIGLYILLFMFPTSGRQRNLFMKFGQVLGMIFQKKIKSGSYFQVKLYIPFALCFEISKQTTKLLCSLLWNFKANYKANFEVSKQTAKQTW